MLPSVLVVWGFAAEDDDDNANDAESVDGCQRSSIDDDVDDGSDRGISGVGGHPYASVFVFGYLFGSLVPEIVGSFAFLGVEVGSARAGVPDTEHVGCRDDHGMVEE